MRFKGDKIVNHALGNKLAREAQFTRKKSITVKSQQTYIEAIRMNTVGGEIPTFPDEKWDKEKETFINKLKIQLKLLL